jgi:predicted permease
MEPVLNKLIVFPLVTALIVWFLPVTPLVKIIIILSNTMPIATSVPILSEQYGRNKGLAVEALVVSTIFSMATIPLVVWLIAKYQF